MQKIINRPETVVMEMCNGIANAHPDLEFIQKYKIIKKNGKGLLHKRPWTI